MSEWMFAKPNKVNRFTLLLLLALCQACAGISGGPSPTLSPAVPVSEERPQQPEAPRYYIRRCCSLCPRAADPAGYADSPYLRDFSVLVDGRDGWLFRSRVDLTTQFELSRESLSELRRLAAALRARGVELVLLYLPPRALMDPDKLTREQLEHYDWSLARHNYGLALGRLRREADVVVAPMDELIQPDKGYEYSFRRDQHWTPDGAQRTARVVARTVRALPGVASIPRRQFETSKVGLEAKSGTLQHVANLLCGGNYALQYVPRFLTVAKADTGAELKSAEQPEIALIGMNDGQASAGHNFIGFLQQELGAEVTVAPSSSATFEGVLQQYLLSEAFQRHPPKVLIWELPHHVYPEAQLDAHKLFRQLVPLVTDGCRGKPVLFEDTIQVQAGSHELLFNQHGSSREKGPLVGKNLQLDFQFNDPSIKDMRVNLWYFNGRKDVLSMHFNEHVTNAGRFVMELRTQPAAYAQAALLGATLEVGPAQAAGAEEASTSEQRDPLTLTVKLCRHDSEAQP